MSRCRVKQCRFSWSHTAQEHVCGLCGQLGHGRMECKSDRAKERLRLASINDQVEAPCNVPGCGSLHHTRDGHHCLVCGTLSPTCCELRVDKKCPQCREVSTVDLSQPLFVNTECVVCYEDKPLILFEKCRHVGACADCCAQLD